MFADPRLTVEQCSIRLAFNPFDFKAYLRRGEAYGRLEEPGKAAEDYSMVLALVPNDDERYGEALFSRSNNNRALGDQAKADADLQEIADRDLCLPSDLEFEVAQECNRLAWRSYLTGPKDQRDPKKALSLARKAVKLEPDVSQYVNTLGVAYYRLGQYPQAVETLQRSLRESQGQGAAFSLLFLAMSHHFLGDAKKAQEDYDEGVRWFAERRAMVANSPWVRQLDELQAEAKAVLAGAVPSNR
jgi:tetratricopeptide (TPR) repeat protein